MKKFKSIESNGHQASLKRALLFATLSSVLITAIGGETFARRLEILGTERSYAMQLCIPEVHCTLQYGRASP